MRHKDMPAKQVTLVYQAGIANVFETSVPDGPIRLLQADFRSCEWFVRGIKAAGLPCFYAWCNQPGDITLQKWNYDSFGDMPFFESISRDFEVA
jgi:hypothetical protein